jgi:hypothetical protein
MCKGNFICLGIVSRLSFFMPGAVLVQIEYQSMETMDSIDI